MALDATVGGASSNSYATVAEADAYFVTHLKNASWMGLADEATKEIYLQSATRYLDQFVDWFGQKVSDDNALDWPRYGFSEYASNEIPTLLKQVVFEMALHLIDNDGVLSNEGSVDKVKVGPINVSLKENGYDTYLFPPFIAAIIAPLGGPRGTGPSSMGSVKLVR